ncbi:hypothetical protein FisN_19Hu290 [Fistulifera solaris]|uniref:Uncharacterized protein n=1 Tax=Fistulifera solaris TaxID=1519565 RepID=A0A1Z5K088_FISSO|nr:hypothetical protein FisN_19Hu290 [Fistulifera solaris]|eukprot:GAX19704.1 hypothetical protein FisN_19Hu290 [Fistulifera solaris]
MIVRIQNLPLLVLFVVAFAAHSVFAEEDTFSWSWCEIFPFTRACKDEEPPCGARALRRRRRSNEESNGFSWTWCEILPFICNGDDDDGGCDR